MKRPFQVGTLVAFALQVCVLNAAAPRYSAELHLPNPLDTPTAALH